MPAAAGSAPLKILHVFRAPLGGLFRHVLDLARGQIARGHAVGIFCDSTTGGARADQVFAELGPQLSLGVTRVPMSRYPSLTDMRAQISEISARKRIAPQIVHAHGSKGGVYARLPALFSSGRRYVTAYTPHGGSFNYKPGSAEHRVYMTIERLLERATDIFLFESAFIAGRFEAHVGHKPRTDHRVVLNGISEAEFEPIDHAGAEFDLVYLGELRSAKGVDTLIEAAALLKRRDGLAPRLLIVGSGPDEALLRQMTVDQGVAAQCVFEPPGPIRAALAKAHVMVIPSRAESLPYVILEAAAAAQPLIATDVGGIKEIYGPGHADRLIATNEPTILADAIRKALATPAAERLAEAADLALHVRANFCLNAMIDGVLDAYRAALAKRGG
ncbi:Glycosyltransferase involved in cell wall bisynthesis [Bosea sp. 62]|uniref:glycosyltransferase family 4 protein n=1 Tax=unclassified Bosea (in: a-proteobacteria) TaxID=2653178 RepID=UPI0012590332|nr:MULTISPECIES: glycosyltransferase family 4 protein [unclassified Bosea (in: a-proteobacteria)]CAD5254880.1 Glycosyltransferase involved in cell wall bisynthesis [Bosea sp. 21B]CAD5285500.1 Glycosyltransferase involved in cell wall bisynthesis [Bosea sp. 7B]CAD5301516.1 Glycosyltransferase involved in cell wall bisynthesis [Bosea sp. 46]VVT57625.1 Glycosyltransferase involved in cell wall bisynthesis [Bosea sp. EC-HK365B]VXB28227.1 Glycosyltransferase involved in cell wall bisynthesis [Bosea